MAQKYDLMLSGSRKINKRLGILPLESVRKQIILPEKLDEKTTATPADLQVPNDQKHLSFQIFQTIQPVFCTKHGSSAEKKTSHIRLFSS